MPKKVVKNPPEMIEAVPQPDLVSKSTAPKEQSVEDMQRQINELKDLIIKGVFQPHQGAQITPGGAVQGIVTKYSVDPELYPDPTPRLAEEPRLAQFAFPLNYELDWSVSTTQYENKQGITIEEPRFTIQLNRIVRDDKGEPTTMRFMADRFSFHEDPAAARALAHELGLDVEQMGGDKAFLDEMRYLRARDWLIGAFYPQLPDPKSGVREVVIGGKVVHMWDKSSEKSEVVPFDQLKKKY